MTSFAVPSGRLFVGLALECTRSPIYNLFILIWFTARGTFILSCYWEFEYIYSVVDCLSLSNKSLERALCVCAVMALCLFPVQLLHRLPSDTSKQLS